MSRRRTNYSTGEVRTLIEDYAAFEAMADTSRRGLRYIIALADLNRALERLPMKLWEVVLLHGLLGVPQGETARLLHVSQQAVSKRYRQGFEDIHYIINGGD